MVHRCNRFILYILSRKNHTTLSQSKNKLKQIHVIIILLHHVHYLWTGGILKYDILLGMLLSSIYN